MASNSQPSLRDSMPQVGQVTWIGLRSAKRGEVQRVRMAEAAPGTGLKGDHFTGAEEHRKHRQVTLIQKEHIPVIAAILEKDVSAIAPALLRRNIVVKGVNLGAFKERTFSVGETVMEWSGWCHPCYRMEENLGPGGYNAMAGHGGIMARVLKGGEVKEGDEVKLVVDFQGQEPAGEI